jgi:hypothetical protein
MVNDVNQSKRCEPVNQGVQAGVPAPIKIGASTPFDFDSRNLTAYGGLLPVATMLENLGFQQLVEETLTVKRQTRAMPVFGFILRLTLSAIVSAQLDLAGFRKAFKQQFNLAPDLARQAGMGNSQRVFSRKYLIRTIGVRRIPRGCQTS